MTLLLGDCLESMAEMDESSVDAVVTDPPYGLGFMGKAWDGMPPGDEVAAAMLRVLKPAHYLVAFGGSRTHHRLMVALEDAGFEIRDVLMWLYGSGFPKGKGNLKPAYEPIILCRKPGKGVRALGIDECRVGTDDTLSGSGAPPLKYGGANHRPFHDTAEPVGCNQHPAGRWPANIILSPEAGAMLDEQSGVSTSTGGQASLGAFRNGEVYGKGRVEVEKRDPGFGDSGGASRFFYCAKASRSERNAGCEGLKERVSLIGAAGHKINPMTGREVVDIPRQNHHPTVKPVALMRWLVRLVTPPGGVVLDPFMGSGTTGVAAAQEGRLFVGIEREPEYMSIAEARIAKAQEQQLTLECAR